MEFRGFFVVCLVIKLMKELCNYTLDIYSQISVLFKEETLLNKKYLFGIIPETKTSLFHFSKYKQNW